MSVSNARAFRVSFWHSRVWSCYNNNGSLVQLWLCMEHGPHPCYMAKPCKLSFRHTLWITILWQNEFTHSPGHLTPHNVRSSGPERTVITAEPSYMKKRDGWWSTNLFSNHGAITFDEHFKITYESAGFHHRIVFLTVILKTKEDIISKCATLYPGLLANQCHWPL